jgi:antitoxin MazE
VRTTIQRWGNSLAMRIPKAFARETNVKVGSAVILTLSEGSLMIRPVRHAKASLKALLSRVDASNVNMDGFEDQPRGEERW